MEVWTEEIQMGQLSSRLCSVMSYFDFQNTAFWRQGRLLSTTLFTKIFGFSLMVAAMEKVSSFFEKTLKSKSSRWLQSRDSSWTSDKPSRSFCSYTVHNQLCQLQMFFLAHLQTQTLVIRSQFLYIILISSWPVIMQLQYLVSFTTPIGHN